MLLRWYVGYKPTEDDGVSIPSTDLSMPAAMMADAQRNRKTLSEMPKDVAAMLDAIHKGEIPGLKNV